MPKKSVLFEYVWEKSKGDGKKSVSANTFLFNVVKLLVDGVDMGDLLDKSDVAAIIPIYSSCSL